MIKKFRVRQAFVGTYAIEVYAEDELQACRVAEQTVRGLTKDKIEELVETVVAVDSHVEQIPGLTE